VLNLATPNFLSRTTTLSFSKEAVL